MSQDSNLNYLIIKIINSFQHYNFYKSISNWFNLRIFPSFLARRNLNSIIFWERKGDVLRIDYFIGHCNGTICNFYSDCKISGTDFECHCPICTDSARKSTGSESREESVSVCGTDGITYSSECALRSKACILQRYISDRHDGPCRPSKGLFPFIY